MASVTCGLTAKGRDQLQNPTLILSMFEVVPGEYPFTTHGTSDSLQAGKPSRYVTSQLSLVIT